jgi:hypothetical protein
MTKYANPTLKDIEGYAPEPADVPAAGGRYANPTLVDMGLASPKQEQAAAEPEYDWGAGNMQFGPWDTGIPLNASADKFITGIGRSYANTGRAAKELLGMQTKKETADQARFDKRLLDTGWGTAGDVTGSIVQTLPLGVGKLAGYVGKGLSKVPGLTGLGSTIGGSMLADAGLVGAVQANMSPVKEGESRLTNTSLGALGSMAGYGVLNTISGTAGKAWNLYKNKWGNARAQALDKLAKQYGIDLSLGDSTKSTGWQLFEDMSKGVPGTKRDKIMERQVGQIQDTLYSLRENVRPDLEVKDATGAVIANYSNPDEMMVGEIQRNFSNLTKEKDKLFADVESVVAANPRASKITMTNTENKLKEMLDSYPDIFANFRTVDSTLVNKLTGLAGDVGSANAGRNPAGQFSKKATYSEAQWLRKRLGALVAQADKQSKGNSPGAITDDAAGQLKQVYKALNNDLDNWGAKPNNEAVHLAYKKAQDYYKENIVPFREHKVLREVVNEHRPFDYDEAMKKMFKRDRGNLAKDIMKFQTPEGQKAAQFVLVDDSIEQALNTNNRAGVDINKFLAKNKEHSAAGKSVYEPEIATQLDDLDHILRASQRSEEYLNTPGNVPRNLAMSAVRTGAPAAVALGTGAAYGAGMIGAAPAMAGLGTLWYGSRLLNQMGSNPVGKRMLMADTELPGGLNYLSKAISERVGSPYAQDKLLNTPVEYE